MKDNATCKGPKFAFWKPFGWKQGLRNRIRVFSSDPVFKLRSEPDPDPFFQINSDPDFEKLSDPVRTLRFKIPLEFNFFCSIIYILAKDIMQY